MSISNTQKGLLYFKSQATGVVVYAEMKLLDRKLRGILQLMAELYMERI